MSDPANNRRSQRLLLRVPVEIRRRTPSGQPLVENTTTLAINAHGALINVSPPVADGEQLVVKNVRSGEEETAKIVYLGPMEGLTMQVGIEFLRPSPQIWGVVFPPDDWGAQKPSEVKSK